MKKLMTRMDRINSVVQVQSVTLAFISLCLYLVVETQINFDGVNSSNYIVKQMPSGFHSKFVMLSCFMLFISIFAFTASYLERNFMFNITQLLLILNSWVIGIVAIISRFTVIGLSTVINESCEFVIP